MGAHDVHQACVEVVSVVLLTMADNRIEETPLEDILVVLSSEDILVERSVGDLLEELLVVRSVELVQQDVIAEALKARVPRLHLRSKELRP